MSKEKYKISQKKYREKNKEKLKEKRLCYYNKNKKKILERKKELRKKYREKEKKYRKKYYKNNRDKLRTNKRLWDKTPKGRYDHYKHGAKARNLPFKITLEQFLDYWNNTCYFCGDIIEGIGLDRLDNTKGYVKNNIVACCSTCNMMKKCQQEKEFISNCKKITENFKNN